MKFLKYLPQNIFLLFILFSSEVFTEHQHVCFKLNKPKMSHKIALTFLLEVVLMFPQILKICAASIVCLDGNQFFFSLGILFLA